MVQLTSYNQCANPVGRNFIYYYILCCFQELAELDTDDILKKQVEQLEKEKRELQERLKSQDKKVRLKVAFLLCLSQSFSKLCDGIIFLDCLHKSLGPEMDEPPGVVYCFTKICHLRLSEVLLYSRVYFSRTL